VSFVLGLKQLGFSASELSFYYLHVVVGKMHLIKGDSEKFSKALAVFAEFYYKDTFALRRVEGGCLFKKFKELPGFPKFPL